MFFFTVSLRPFNIQDWRLCLQQSGIVAVSNWSSAFIAIATDSQFWSLSMWFRCLFLRYHNITVCMNAMMYSHVKCITKMDNARERYCGTQHTISNRNRNRANQTAFCRLWYNKQLLVVEWNIGQDARTIYGIFAFEFNDFNVFGLHWNTIGKCGRNTHSLVWRFRFHSFIHVRISQSRFDLTYFSKK